MKRRAQAIWQGGLKDGHGTISTESRALSEIAYSFGARFEDGAGTNPEELLGAAHSGCFSMALALVLGESNITADRIDTAATVSIEPTDDGFTITSVHLSVAAAVPGLDRESFDSAIETTKAACPVSNLFNANVTVDAQLES